MKNSHLLRGKNSIGQEVFDRDNNKGVITKCWTGDGGSQVYVTIQYNDGTYQTRQKDAVKKGKFKKPILFNLDYEINNGFKRLYGYEDYYIINKKGVIKPIKGKYRGESLSHNKHSNSKYISVSLNYHHRGPKFLHRLLAETFIRPLKKGEQVDHINGDPADNRLSNLRIVSRKNNNRKHIDISEICSKEEENKIHQYCESQNINLYDFLRKSTHFFLNSL